MCGICGYAALQGSFSTEKGLLIRMTEILHHRGPDDCGFLWEFEDRRIEKDELLNIKMKAPIRVALGHRRLSIIDLSSEGRQPMPNRDETVWVVFNGEIYNYRELRQEAGDYPFRSKTDTESILSAYERYGDRFVERLDGMFALALWDKNKRKLILSRDPMGKKPLYYAIEKGVLVFSSELKSLLLHPLVNREIDPLSLRKYLFYGYIPSPNSIFKKVKKLRPGHILVFTEKGIETRPYWNLSFKKENISEQDAISEFKWLFDDAVRKRLMSDVPLGVFLSGGIDSSSVALTMSKFSSKVKTFSIGFFEKGYDELRFARRVAKDLGFEHYDEILDIKKMLEVIPKVPEIADEPMADASLIPTYLLSQITRKKVTVVLGGDGGDELFFGYPTYLGHRVAEGYKKLPEILKKPFEKAVRLLPTRLGNYTFDYMAKRFIAGVKNSPPIRHYIWKAHFQPDEILKLLEEDVDMNPLFEDIEDYLKDCDSSFPLERVVFLDMKIYLPESILVKVDKASMANSLEVRAPFLDKKLIGFINSLPVEFKLKGITGKYLLKKAMKKELPDEVLYRKKQGFCVPIGRWVKDELRDFTVELLETAIFNKSFIKGLLDEHFLLKKDNWKQIWALIVFCLWYNKYIKDEERGHSFNSDNTIWRDTEGIRTSKTDSSSP